MHRPRTDVIVGTVNDDARSTIEMYRLRGAIDRDIAAIFVDG